MSLSLFPPSVILLPEAFQSFQAQSTPPPAYWNLITNGVVNSDFSVSPIDSSSQVLAYGVHLLRQGFGTVTWTIDLSAMPANAGLFNCNLQDADQSIFAGFEYQRSINQVRVYNQSGNIATIPVTLTTGDRLALEAAGSIWRFYIFSASVTQIVPFNPPAGIKYPCFYASSLVPPLIPSSKLLTPGLTGDWSRLFDPDWTLTGQGTLTPASGTASVQYYAGVSNVGVDPGVYIVTAQYAGSTFEQATATVTVPPLQITGPSAVSLNPGQTVKFDTNYNEASQQFSWTAIGGGSIAADGTYTAPTSPGTYTVRASYKTQHADITVTIGATITPTISSAAPGQVINFSTNLPSPVWTATCGTFLGSVWTAPSTPGVTCTVTMTSGSTVVKMPISILDFFPFDPSVVYTLDTTKRVLISTAEDGTRTARVKNRNNIPQRKYELTFRNRDLLEYESVENFWESHHPDKSFVYKDHILGLDVVVYFDSDLRMEPQAGCPIDYSFRLVEKPS